VARLVRQIGVALALTFAAGTLAVAGDWLNLGGDAQHSNWQKRGTQLSTGNVKELKLLWKRPTDSGPSAPVILGPTITHRGVRELVFVATASNKLYAYDADLGSLFWMRQIESAATAPCGSNAAATPVIEPNPRPRKEDDEPNAMRPIYVLATDGRLHKIRASDGADIEAPVKFLAPGAHASDLNFADGMVYAGTVQGCAGAPDGVWAIDVKAPGAAPVSFATNESQSVSIGTDGNIHCVDGDRILSLSTRDLRLKDTLTAASALTIGPVAFDWQGRTFFLSGGKRGLLLTGPARAEASGEFAGGLATWQDASGVRWIYASTAGGIAAFQVVGTPTRPKLEPSWTRAIKKAGALAISNGVVFVLAGGPTLHALDAATGAILYSSGEAAVSGAFVPALSVANGHVLYTATDGTLYCFGTPIEQQ
jgi:outer membrane protein assembly factor BamB